MAQHLIKFFIEKGCHNLQIFGDSKIVYDWINKPTTYHTYTLGHLLEEIHRCMSHFESFDCHHIYRERNTITNQISKTAAIRPRNVWLIQEQRGVEHFQYYHRPYMDHADQAQ